MSALYVVCLSPDAKRRTSLYVDVSVCPCSSRTEWLRVPGALLLSSLCTGGFLCLLYIHTLQDVGVGNKQTTGLVFFSRPRASKERKLSFLREKRASEGHRDLGGFFLLLLGEFRSSTISMKCTYTPGKETVS